MVVGTLLILIAWFVEMPLWLSIVVTVFSALRIFARTIEFFTN